MPVKKISWRCVYPYQKEVGEDELRMRRELIDTLLDAGFEYKVLTGNE